MQGMRRVMARRWNLTAATLALLITGTAFLQAQPGRGAGGVIGGVIADSESGEGLPGATIALWNAADSGLVTGMAADINGGFRLEGIRPGNYYLKISSIGYLTRTVPDISLRAGSMEAALGTIGLEVDPELDADAVTITGERSDVEFRSDRTVYNVEDQAVSTGGNAIDVLKTVPQVEVDIDDNVSLRGSNNVAVQINGRPVPINGEALASFLKSLPADMIVKVEIIPNPSAKYDPEGMAGIINIVLKEKKEEGGVSGNISVTGGIPNQVGVSGSINLRGSKLNLFSSYGFRYNERNASGILFRENRIPGFAVNFLDQTSDGERIRRSHVLNNTLDWTVDPKNTLSASAVVSYRGGNSLDLIDYTIWDLGALDTSRTLRTSPESDGGLNMDYSLTHRWVAEPSRHELVTEVRFNTDNDEDRATYIERAIGEIQGDSLVQRQRAVFDEYDAGGTLQSDYVRPIGEKGRLETGYKGEFRTINNSAFSESLDLSSGEFEPDTDLNNEFRYDEWIHAAYAIYNHTFGKLDAQIGLRGEYVLTDFNLLTTDEIFENDYTSLYPSAAASYAFSERTRLRASVSRRVQRPGVWRLNPFTEYEDRLNRHRGNPYLRPEYTNSVEASLSHFTDWGTLSFSPYYRHMTDQIERWLTIDSQGVSTVSWENFASTDMYGADIVATFRLGERVRGYASSSLYQIDLDGTNIDSDLANDAFGWSVAANASVVLLDWLDFQANWHYRAPVRISGGEIDAFTSLDAAIKATFLEKRASLSLRASDIFNTMQFSLFRSDDTYFVDMEREWQSQGVTLTFSYDFGSRDNSRQRQQRRNGGGGGEEMEDMGM